ncbi:S8 family peptidase [Paludibaculum fermentans]|uniref:S8 family peptidase n=1 Tax=Paludibaculum fermentans TaxID=1473598 RepID=A0A7S7NKK1_PALFE|nr:S8 family peptidase [Paludibaculum fermentans]QOY85340.1 S8 family peptidase [Paludibaculum fermentans]
MPDPPVPAFSDDNNRLNESLAKSIITEPLYGKIRREASGEVTARPQGHRVIIEVNLEFAAGRQAAVQATADMVEKVLMPPVAPPVGGADPLPAPGSHLATPSPTLPFLFAQLMWWQIFKLVQLNEDAGKLPRQRPIYHIWDDHEVSSMIVESVRTVKADAARVAFGARGQGITWAVLDSGIDASHEHFKSDYKNLELELPLSHWDFTGLSPATVAQPVDPYGHGSHVAGIIAGSYTPPAKELPALSLAARRQENAGGLAVPSVQYTKNEMGKTVYTGIAPAARLVSLRVLDEAGKGRASSIISAIEKILEINDYGRYLLIHGANLSVGYAFEPEWFACGQSPLCVAVNRLVRSGVVVVVAAGNTGYGLNRTQFAGPGSAGLMVSINDPGNAQDAITVGSTHRDSPHVYGVSYFSSKGPTGDGRLKPDLVAPGEKIQSCAAGKLLAQTGVAVTPEEQSRTYLENSGTSMAAPHVSGAVAAFLSIRREFIGQPSVVKNIFLESATDLGRERYFQGRGLLDLMRVIQSV